MLNFSLSICSEYATSSESETEGPLVDQAWRGDCDSDAESVDSEQEDPLKLASQCVCACGWEYVWGGGVSVYISASMQCLKTSCKC